MNSGNCCLLFAAGNDQAFHPPKNPMPFFSLGNSHQNMQWLKRWVDQWTKDRNSVWVARAQYAGNFCNSSCSSWPNSCRLAMKKLQQEVSVFQKNKKMHSKIYASIISIVDMMYILYIHICFLYIHNIHSENESHVYYIYIVYMHDIHSRKQTKCNLKWTPEEELQYSFQVTPSSCRAYYQRVCLYITWVLPKPRLDVSENRGTVFPPNHPLDS